MAGGPPGNRKILVLDNGSSKIKAGWSGAHHPTVKLPNCVGQVRSTRQRQTNFVCDQCYILPEYFCHRPSQEGLVLDADLQREIWERVFSKAFMNVDPAQTSILVTEPFLSPPPLRHTLSEVIFEDFGFAEMLISPAQTLIPYAFLQYHPSQQVGAKKTTASSSPPLSYQSLTHVPKLFLDRIPSSPFSEDLPLSCYTRDPPPPPPDSMSLMCAAAGGGRSSVSKRNKKKKSKTSHHRTSRDACEPAQTDHGGMAPAVISAPQLWSGSSPWEASAALHAPYTCSSSALTSFLLSPSLSFSSSPASASSSSSSLSERPPLVNPCCLSIDCGFSCCHCMCYYDLCPMDNATLRTDVGGGHLNAALKHLLNYRHLNLDAADLLVQHIKEETCFVSQAFDEELNLAQQEMKQSNRSHLYYEYSLPDYNVQNKSLLNDFFSHTRPWPPAPQDSPILHYAGLADECSEKSLPRNKSAACGEGPSNSGGEQARKNEGLKFSSLDELKNDSPGVMMDDNTSDGNAVLAEPIREVEKSVVRLNNERICVSEILFNPQDVNLNVCGIADLVYRTICRAPEELQPFLCERMLLVGGTSKTIGFKQRLWTELRQKLPEGTPRAALAYN
eukprot:GHVQ01033109.1.p1 GENE.GHVQ01033109.1~~GHVQ01033109.1.p1  ORF type:complete len:616 (-),score=75.29 GHVQ01033109.1:606-2453(-)